jgi:hypothetical protein
VTLGDGIATAAAYLAIAAVMIAFFKALNKL